jgi:uncharacterized protein (TIGR02453 family)
MIQKSTIDFLKKLKQNNNKAWFDKNRPAYEISKKDFISFLETIIEKISSFDNSVKGLEAKNCIFRINRDIRFSNDKTPYKSNFGASISKGGKKSFYPGYYIHIEPGKSFLAGGIWMPPAPELNAIRQEIDYNTSDFKKIIKDKSFIKYFGGLDEEDKLKTAPKGYPKDHPEIDLLKYKSYIVVHYLKDQEVLSRSFEKHCIEVFKVLYPFDKFLRKAID